MMVTVFLHPGGMPAISRGLSEATPPESVWDSHPEGMPARLNLFDMENLPASLQDANPRFGPFAPGVSRTLNPRLIADILSG